MNAKGSWIWYELMTTDPVAAARFYGDVVGWTLDDHDPQYVHVVGRDGFVGGMFRLTPDLQQQGAHPAWFGYLAVDDVDASVASIEAKGGRVHVPPRDLPRVGRFAMVADPQGAPIYVMRTEGEDTSPAFRGTDRPTVGHCAWNELYTSDPSGALDFYTSEFGWQKDGEMDMGPMGKYEFLNSGGAQIGALMRRPPNIPQSVWTFYFRVESIDAAITAIQARGGHVLHGPNEVPGGDVIVQGRDPQGATFALIGKRS